MLRKHHGMRCVYKNCRNKFYNIGFKTSFFRVPKDQTRCKEWLQACGRSDLVTDEFDASKAYAKYRVCSAHFENSMFYNSLDRKRLLRLATPILFRENEPPNPVTSIKNENIQEMCQKTDTVSTSQQNIVTLVKEEKTAESCENQNVFRTLTQNMDFEKPSNCFAVSLKKEDNIDRMDQYPDIFSTLHQNIDIKDESFD